MPNFVLSLHLTALFMYASSEGSDKTVHMHADVISTKILFLGPYGPCSEKTCLRDLQPGKASPVCSVTGTY